VPVAEVARWLPLRCSHRASVSTLGFAPEIPDWANDQHTLAGRKLGRGMQHFREEGAKLVPPPATKDAYEDEAYRLWAIKAARGERATKPDDDDAQLPLGAPRSR